jgi:hyperosmotically inducible protein
MIRSDEAIKKDIVDSLYWDSRADASEVGVKVKNRIVTLSGKVASPRAGRAAIEDSRLVKGVTGIENKLQTAPPPIPSDDDIKKSIEQSIVWDPDFEESKIEVQVAAGLVTLKGSVDEHWKRATLEGIAAAHPCVWEVSDKLTVVPTKDIADETIANDIDAALERNALVDRDDVQVQVVDGVVTLRGSVPNLSARVAACRVAQYTGGVREVTNQLRIAP